MTILANYFQLTFRKKYHRIAQGRLKIWMEHSTLITLDFLIDAHVRLFIFAEEIVPVRAY